VGQLKHYMIIMLSDRPIMLSDKPRSKHNNIYTCIYIYIGCPADVHRYMIQYLTVYSFPIHFLFVSLLYDFADYNNIVSKKDFLLNSVIQKHPTVHYNSSF